MLKVTLCFISSISVLGGSVVSPVMGLISQHFAGVNPVLISLILTLPAIFVIMSSVLSVYLSKRIGKKNTLLIALFLYAVSGTMTGFMDNIYTILACRAIFGVATGLLMPVSQSLPTDFFEGIERVQVLARAGSFIPLGNIVFIPIAGVLGYFSWRYSFMVYLIAIPIFLFVYFFIPDKRVATDLATKAKKPMPFNVYVPSFAMFAFMLCGYLYFTNISLIITERGIGSSIESGIVLAITSLCSFLCGFNLVHLRRLLGKYIVATICLAFSLSYCILYYADSLFMIFLAIPFFALSFGIIMPLTSVTISNRAKETYIVQGMAMFTVSIFLGQFLSPFVYHYLPHLPGHDSNISTFLTISIVACVVSFILFVFALFKKEVKAVE